MKCSSCTRGLCLLFHYSTIADRFPNFFSFALLFQRMGEECGLKKKQLLPFFVGTSFFFPAALFIILDPSRFNRLNQQIKYNNVPLPYERGGGYVSKLSKRRRRPPTDAYCHVSSKRRRKENKKNIIIIELKVLKKVAPYDAGHPHAPTLPHRPLSTRFSIIIYLFSK